MSFYGECSVLCGGESLPHSREWQLTWAAGTWHWRDVSRWKLQRSRRRCSSTSLSNTEAVSPSLSPSRFPPSFFSLFAHTHRDALNGVTAVRHQPHHRPGRTYGSRAVPPVFFLEHTHYKTQKRSDVINKILRTTRKKKKVLWCRASEKQQQQRLEGDCCCCAFRAQTLGAVACLSVCVHACARVIVCDWVFFFFTATLIGTHFCLS